MRILSGVVCLGLLSLAGTVSAQSPYEGRKGVKGESIMAPIPPTPEMWFYDQELKQRYSPQLAVRRKAEFETSQRLQRMANREWWGVSASRPSANPTPMTSSFEGYSHSWWGYRNTSTVIVPSTRPTYNVW